MCNTDRSKKLQCVRDNIESFPDFPKPGVLFRDIFSVLRNPSATRCLFELLEDEVKKLGNVDAIVGLEARGFLLGVYVASCVGVPFVPIRKKGKLPGKVKQASFSLEYGNDILEIREDSILPNQRIVIIDDVLATGGTLSASCQLITGLGANIVQCLVIIELLDLKGRCTVPAAVNALIVF